MSELGNDSLEGVILAAGQGTRMRPFSQHYPKPLLPILNVPLIHHQILYLKELGAKRVTVVVGHLGHEIALHLGGETSLGVPIELVEQRDSLGIAHAVMQIEPLIHGPFALLLGDVYLAHNTSVDPVAFTREHGANGFLSVHRVTDPAAMRRDFAVYTDDDGVVVHRVVEKQRFPKTQWKGSGLYMFDQSFFDAVRRTPRTAGRNEYELTDAIQIYIEDGAKVVAADALDWDLNLTFPYDLLLANIHALRGQGRDVLVSPEARIHPESTLQECVIGARVRIDEPVRMRRSLVFEDAVVPVHEPLDRVVVTPEQLVDCRFWIDGNGELVPGAYGRAS